MLRIGRVVFTWKGCLVVNPTQKGDVEEEIVHFGDMWGKGQGPVLSYKPIYLTISIYPRTGRAAQL